MVKIRKILASALYANADRFSVANIRNGCECHPISTRLRYRGAMPNVVPSSACDRDEAVYRSPRKNLFLTATLAADGIGRAVRVRNLSASGALVEAATLPPAGSPATLQRGSLIAHGMIVWRAEGRGGLQFADPIDLTEWIPGAAGDGQMQVDCAIAESRGACAVADAPMAGGDAMAAIDPGLRRRTADELAFVSRRLEALGDSLTNDAHVVMRHAASLQELDISMQILGHIARLLVADRPGEVVKAIGMTDLRRRLQRNSPI